MDSKPQTGVMRREFSLLPSTLGEAREMADLIANSDFAPKDYKGKPANVIIAVQMGADLGLKPMQALQNIAVINGKPSIYGDGALALVLAAGVLDDFKESFEGEGDSLTAVCEAKRKGMSSPVRNTFSVQDAKAANLWGKAGPWQTYPKRMLKFRARGFTLRDVASDILLGLILAEEAMDFPEAIDTTAVAVEEVRNAPVDPMERIPEAMRDNVEKAFTTLNMAPGQRLAKLNEYFGKEGVTPEEAAQALLDWCKDEYSRRKTGQPRKQTNNKPAKPEEPKQTVSNPQPPATTPAPPPVKDAEVVEPKPAAVASADIPWGNQGAKVDGEMF